MRSQPSVLDGSLVPASGPRLYKNALWLWSLLKQGDSSFKQSRDGGEHPEEDARDAVRALVIDALPDPTGGSAKRAMDLMVSVPTHVQRTTMRDPAQGPAQVKPRKRLSDVCCHRYLAAHEAVHEAAREAARKAAREAAREAAPEAAPEAAREAAREVAQPNSMRDLYVVPTFNRLVRLTGLIAFVTSDSNTSDGLTRSRRPKSVEFNSRGIMGSLENQRLPQTNLGPDQ